ncbi:MAG: hypothetical protein NC311_06250 [Muribaculaceae bacterium]|nr:hypothetical protein [Muribaculaceae bacterium]
MRNIKKIFGVAGIVAMLAFSAGAMELAGTASVNVTSDTAAAAKAIALNQARRQILNQVLSKYANADQVQVAVKNAKSDELMNLISSSSIDGERQSDTAYSANITMVVDAASARQWMLANDIQNWMDNGAANSSAVVVLISMSDRVANWMELKQIARNVNVDLDTQYIMGNQATIKMPVARQSAFVSAVRGAGWGVQNQNGGVRIWK